MVTNLGLWIVVLLLAFVLWGALRVLALLRFLVGYGPPKNSNLPSPAAVRAATVREWARNRTPTVAARLGPLILTTTQTAA